jgi:hypothetical protein
MNFRKRIEFLEKTNYQEESIVQPHDPDDKVHDLIARIGREGLKRVLQIVDGKTRGLPSQRE